MISKYVKMPHQFDRQLKPVGKVYCSYCGLVLLNNKFTEWAVKMGCMNNVHPEYQAKRKEYTGT